MNSPLQRDQFPEGAKPEDESKALESMLAQTPSSQSGRSRQEWLTDLVSSIELTPKGREIAEFVAVNPRFSSFASTAEIGAQTDTNPATVVRFAQAIGFSGWKDFQINLRHRYLGSLRPSDVLHDQSPPASSSPAEESLRRDIENLQTTLDDLPLEHLNEVAAIIADAPRTLCITSGSYAAVGSVFAHHASFMGYDVQIESRGGPHIIAALSRLEPGDCIVAISFWKLIKEVVRATERANHRGLTTVAITDSAFSPLSRAADHSLEVPTEGVSFFQSMTAALALVNSLLAELRVLGGDEVERTIVAAEGLYDDLDVLY